MTHLSFDILASVKAEETDIHATVRMGPDLHLSWTRPRLIDQWDPEEPLNPHDPWQGDNGYDLPACLSEHGGVQARETGLTDLT